MRTLLIAFCICFSTFVTAQTQYWVGGSGNFNDANHWSLTSGGPSSNQIPNAATSVIFDDNSGSGAININLSGASSVKSFQAKNSNSTILFTGANNAVVDVNGSIDLGTYAKWEFGGTLNIQNTLPTVKHVYFGLYAVNGEVRFNQGALRIYSFTQAPGHKLKFKNGNYILSKSSISSDEIIIEGNNSVFKMDTSMFVAKNKLKITDNPSFITYKSAVYAPFSDNLKVNIPQGFNFGAGAQMMDNLLMAVCGATISIKPACTGTCTGVFSVTLDPSCLINPYNVIVTTGLPGIPDCNNTSTLLSGNGVPLTYSIGGACECPGNQYNVFILEGGAIPIPITIIGFPGTNFNFTPPSFGIATITQSQPVCFAACNGTWTQALGGGLGPYTVNVTPPLGGPSTLTAGAGFTMGGLCAGVYTFVVTDANGCVSTPIFKTMLGPSQIQTNSVVTHVACFGGNTGSVTISPTGGNPGNYTVNFSPGGTFTLSPGGTASVTGQTAGTTINVTVTGIGGCTVGTSVTFTSPTQLTVTSTQTNVTCSGGSNGVASVSVSGGVAPYQYTWTPGPGGNTTTIGGLPVGTQTVTISNNGGQCVTTRTFNITGPNAWTITPTFSNVQCPAPSPPNGSATINITAGSGNGGPYTFTWNPGGQNTPTVNNIGAGVYTVTIGDNSPFPGCFTTAIITITAPPVFTVSTITQSLLCFGVCNGAATVNIAGGTGPYTYTWNPVPPVGQGTNVISSLCAINYTVNITDFKGCPQNASVSITQPASVSPNVTTSSVTCFGLCNGVINSTPTGGNAPYTFTLITPAATTLTSGPAASASFSNRCVGLHTLFISGATGCTQSVTANITQPNLLTISIATTAVSCFSLCNGSVSSLVGGGTPGYTVVWNTPGGTFTAGALAGQCAGNYTATVFDANGCSASATMNLVQPPQITATITPTNPTCAGGLCNGILTAVVAGGSPGYTLTWSSGVGNPNINRCAGVYTLTVTDNNGCTQPFTQTLTAPPAITLTVNSSSPSCAGGNNGSATITASGGTPGYTFQCVVPPLTTNTTGIFTGFIAGGYIVSVTDANGCPTSTNFNISSPPVLSVPVVSIVSSCNACTGGATVAPAGGTPTYAIVWTNSLAVVVGTTAGLSNLCAGPYTITVTDAAGCVVTTTLTIVQTVNVNVSIAGSGILCNNACTGTAVATATGGTLPYTYLWAPSGQTTQIATGLCAGVHTVSVADASLCSNTATINFVNPPPINVVTSQTNVTCFSFSNGAISATASGGTGIITYSWMPGGFTTTSISNLTAGVYTLTVTDANGCSPIPLTFTITSNPSVTATFTTTNPSGCAPITNGSICITPSGGNGGPYTQTWSPGGFTTTCITGLGAGAYSVTITDGIGCTFTLNTSLTNPAGPTLTVLQQNINCFGGNTGGATVTASGVGPAYTFTWNPVVSFTNSPATSTVSGLVTGTYIVAATGSNNCIATQSISILQAPQLTVTSVVTNPACNTGTASCNGSITLVTSGGTPTYTFAWSPGVIVGQGTQTVTNLCAGPPIYTVTITDASLCVQQRTFNLTVPPAITLSTTFTNITCFSFSNGIASATASGGTAPLTYSWLPIGGFAGAITPSITGLGPNVYTVVVTDGNTCTAQATVAITQPTAPLTTTLTSLNASCSNSCNGTATILAAGGTPTYAFSWSGLPATTSTVNGLCAGFYTATVTDSKGCTSPQAFTITAPAPFTATLIPSSPLCNSACTGSIVSNLSGAQGTVSYVWTPAGVGPNPTGLCASVYTLVATDANSCVANAVITLTNPPAINANVTTTNPACNNFCNGVAVSSPSNATNPIQYTWLPAGPNSPINSSLCAGPYTLNLLDANSCTASVQFTLSNPPAVTINPAVTPASCGFSNGVISLGLSGGTPTFLVVWQPGPIPNGTTAINLGAGVYTANITDFNGCTNSVTIPLGNSSGPTVTPVSSTSVACSGSCTGGATVQVGGISGGTPPYLATWLVPPAPSSVNPLSNLCAGTYTAQIVDATLPVGCIVFTTVVISQPPPIIINPTFTLPTCNGAFNGAIILNTSGGTPLPAYTYTWAPQANATATLINAGAGTHTIQILDGNLCPSTQTVNLPAALNMTVLINPTQNPCFGNCLGSATVANVLNGLAPFDFSWSNGQTTTNSFTSAASGLCNGNYTVIVTDANGCNNSFTTNIISPTQITASSAITAPSCSLCNGSATITPSGGNGGPYQFNWTNSATTAVVGNLCAGLYQVLITENTCTVTQNIMVSSVPGITGETFTTQNVTCAGNCNGSITVAPIGGAPAITYSWIAPASTSPSLTGLCAGVYFVQMTDALGCIRTASTQITAANALSVSPFVTQPSCNPPGANGAITLVPSGGTPGYTINWAAPLAGTLATQSGLNGGVYSATITDQVGCALTQTFNLSNSTAPIITYTQTNINCFNACTGIIIAEATGTAVPITYTWSVGGNLQTVNNLCKGVVTLTVTDGNNCRAFQSFTITDRPAMQLSLSNTVQPKCNGDCDGQITLIPSGGTLPYTFSWSPGGSSVNPTASLCAGPGSVTVYTGTVTDALGCRITETINLINPPLLVLTNTLMNSTCSSAKDGSASVSLAGGTATFSFNWVGSPTIAANNTQSITGVGAGDYTVTVVDSKGCTKQSTLTIVPTITISATAIPDFSLCPGTMIVLNGTNSIGANSYNWYVLPSPTVAVGGNTSTISFTQAPGTFSYVLEAVSTATNCLDSDMVVVTVYSLPFVDAGQSFTIPLFSSVTIGGAPTATGAATYTWFPANTLDNSNIPNPLASNTINTTYTVIVVDPATGCTASDTVQVFLYPAIKIPNGFSPNGDNKNDRWVIDYIDQFTENEVEIYNRWGELLFRKVGYLDHFDGKYKGKDLPVGTYYYIIKLNHDAYPKPFTGPLTIFR